MGGAGKEAAVTIRRIKDGLIVVRQVEVAKSLKERLIGLIGRSWLPDGQGLLIRQCSSVHTFFMRFPIDVVYLDSKLVVIAVDAYLKPWRFGRIHRKAKHVLEVPCRSARQLKAGDRFEFIGEEGA